MEDISIVSALICRSPLRRGGRYILSASPLGLDAAIPEEVRARLTDGLGNPSPVWSEDVQFPDLAVLSLIEARGLVALFRGVRACDLDYVLGVAPAHRYAEILTHGSRLGWDICSGNGWLTASAHGAFPVDTVTGEALSDGGEALNGFALFDDLGDCLDWIAENDRDSPEHAPWYPVALYASQRTSSMLQTMVRHGLGSNA